MPPSIFILIHCERGVPNYEVHQLATIFFLKAMDPMSAGWDITLHSIVSTSQSRLIPCVLGTLFDVLLSVCAHKLLF